jgi:hypothetical protein
MKEEDEEKNTYPDVLEIVQELIEENRKRIDGEE